jgi:hypothetical protein
MATGQLDGNANTAGGVNFLILKTPTPSAFQTLAQISF